MATCVLNDETYLCTGSGAISPQDANTVATSIVIEENIIEISDKCFAGFTHVTSVSLPDSLEKIGNDAFSSVEISSLLLPKGVKTISSVNSFDTTPALEEINVAEENQYFKSIDGVLYSKNMKTIWFYSTKKKSTTFVVPFPVENIEWNVLSENNYLVTVVLPPSLKKIKEYSCRFGVNTKSIIVLRFKGNKRKINFDVSSFQNKQLTEDDIIYTTVNPPKPTSICRSNTHSWMLIIISLIST